MTDRVGERDDKAPLVASMPRARVEDEPVYPFSGLAERLRE